MMSTWKRLVAKAWLVLGAFIWCVIATVDVRAEVPAVDPVAVQKLKQSTDFLAGLPQFSVKTANVIEDLQFAGHRVDYDVSNSVTVKRPDKMRAARAGGLMDQRLFYDGKSMTLYNPNEKVYATEQAPDTIEKMIELAREKIGILLPAADLLYRNAFPLLMQDVTLAVVVGESVIDGVKCTHLLFSRPQVDFQLWIANGAQPWPLKYVVTETGTPERLSVTTVLSDWNTAPAVDDALFHFVPPPGTQAIEFLPLESTGGPTR
jgi:hypothetical protein